ncbi:MAG: apolipoprotein N-acyltransferase [Actinobacteria bacterium]|nr:apolipoprotein N-acyltransferase [Actinomycetota bacterium]
MGREPLRASYRRARLGQYRLIAALRRQLTRRDVEVAPPRFRCRWAALLALAGGLIGVLAFPRFGIWPLAAISIAALSLAVDGRRARTGAWLGLLYGLAFFVPLLSWTGVYVGPVPWLILAAAEAGYLAALGAALAVLQRLRAPAWWIGAAWVAEEAVRDRAPFGGFPWGRWAFSQAESPLRWFAALGGAPLVSFAVAVAGGALTSGVVAGLRAGPAWRQAWSDIARSAAVVVLVPLLATGLSWPLHPAADRHGTTTTIALVQGSVPDRGLAFEDRPREVLDNHVAQTLKLADEIRAGNVARPSLVVWPENASDLDPFADAQVYAEIDQTVRTIGIPILVGAILQGPGADHRRNAGILWSPTTGPGAQYIKRHPVPFAEYIPLRSVARVFSSDVDLVTQDMVAGRGNGLLRGGPFPIGDVICFEVAYDDLVRSSVAAGARLLVVQTNNATFGHTSETYQQLAMSQLRAVETGRTVVQVSTTGASAVIGPDGRIRAASGALFQPDVIVASVPLRTNLTIAVRLGAGPEYLLCAAVLLALGAILLAGAQRRRSARGGRPEPTPGPAATGKTPPGPTPARERVTTT